MTKPLNQRVVDARLSGKVRRCHTIPHLYHYDVAQHTYNMLTLLDLLHPNPSLNLYRAILWHDAAEKWVGDIPKRENIPRDLRDQIKKIEGIVADMEQIPNAELFPSEQRWLDALDSIEFWLWALEEWVLFGNTSAKEHYSLQYERLNEMDLPEPCRKFVTGFEWP